MRHARTHGGFVAQTLVGEVAAWQVDDVLRGAPRPPGVMGEGIAFKTGTSYGHRDAVAVGFDGRHVVAVWMGRPDGTAVPRAFEGRLAARVSDGVPPFTWLANGLPVGTSRGREMALDPGPGFSAVVVVDASGGSARASFELRAEG